MRSLTWKLTLVLLSMSLFSIASVFLLTRWVNVREFDRLVNAQARETFLEQITTYYRIAGTWQGVMTAVPAPDAPPPGPNNPNPGPPRVPYALLNNLGCVVLPAGPYRLGNCPPLPLRDQNEPLSIDGELVGTIVKVRDLAGRGPLEEAYILRTDRALFFSAIGITFFAIVLGTVVARTLIQPLKTLTSAIHALKAGEMGQQVPVHSEDELGELADAFNQMSADLAHANQLRRDMTADIAHELRNPLHVITGYLESMRDGVLQPTPERLATLYDEASHLQHLVNDLRTLSSADAGELALQTTPVAPHELLTRVCAVWEEQATQQQIDLRYQVPTELPTLHLDPERMMQVLNNLMSNALRYTPTGGQITLSARAVAHGIEFAVQDSGQGIAQELLPFVFERFYRIDPSHQTALGGTGLGLAIARSIVEAHGGTITATSAGLGHGTTFFLRLSLSPPR